jgi:hypothetical protein
VAPNPFKAFSQIVTGLWEFAHEFDPTAYLPEWLLRLTIYALPAALMADEPKDQIEGALIMMGWGIIWSLLGPFATALWVLAWSPFLLIGILRLSDAGDNAWDSATGWMPGVSADGSYSTRSK